MLKSALADADDANLEWSGHFDPPVGNKAGNRVGYGLLGSAQPGEAEGARRASLAVGRAFDRVPLKHA